MYHSITFGEKNTWDDWHLIPSSRPVINPPGVITHTVEVPGGNGVIDLSEILTGRPVFGNRTGEIEFIVDNGHESWVSIYQKVLSYLHGQRVHAVLEDDPGYYYEGRVTVNEWQSEEHNSTITLSYDFYPFKRLIRSTKEPWLWDPFSFETGVVRNYGGIKVDGSREVIVPGGSMPEMLVIEAVIAPGESLIVSANGKSYPLSTGLNKNPNIIIYKTPAALLFSGKGTISIEYKGGEL